MTDQEDSLDYRAREAFGKWWPPEGPVSFEDAWRAGWKAGYNSGADDNY